MDFEEISEIIKAGGQGKVMDVIDEEEGERVEIFVE